MSAEQIEQVKFSFERICPIAADAAELYCKHLFFLGTLLRPMFNALTLLESLAPVLGQIGVRHAEYGVTKKHYAAVGAALFLSLEHGLGYHFTPDVRCAWTTAFEFLSSTMQAGVRRAAN